MLKNITYPFFIETYINNIINKSDKTDNPYFIIAYGPPASGKGSILEEVLKTLQITTNKKTIVHVDLDKITQDIIAFHYNNARINESLDKSLNSIKHDNAIIRSIVKSSGHGKYKPKYFAQNELENFQKELQNDITNIDAYLELLNKDVDLQNKLGTQKDKLIDNLNSEKIMLQKSLNNITDRLKLNIGTLWDNANKKIDDMQPMTYREITKDMNLLEKKDLYSIFRYYHSNRISDLLLNRTLLKRANILWETTGTGFDWIDKEIKRIKGYNYNVAIVYPMALFVKYLENRKRNRLTQVNASDIDIRHSHFKAQENLLKLINLVDRTLLFNNEYAAEYKGFAAYHDRFIGKKQKIPLMMSLKSEKNNKFTVMCACKEYTKTISTNDLIITLKEWMKNHCDKCREPNMLTFNKTNVKLFKGGANDRYKHKYQKYKLKYLQMKNFNRY